MSMRESIKPISYLKAHIADIFKAFSEGKRQSMVITQNGEAKAVLQDISGYEKTMESLAMLKLLAQSTKSIQSGKTKTVKQGFADIRRQVKESRQARKID